MSLPNCKILDKFLIFNPFPSAPFWAGDYKNLSQCTKLMERNLDVRFISTDLIKHFHISGVPPKWHETFAVEVLNCKCWFTSDTSNRAFNEPSGWCLCFCIVLCFHILRGLFCSFVIVNFFFIEIKCRSLWLILRLNLKFKKHKIKVSGKRRMVTLWVAFQFQKYPSINSLFC